MKIKFEANTFTFDTRAFIRDVEKICKKHLSDFEKEYLEAMGKVIDDVDTKGDFKKAVKGLLKHLSTEVVDGVITYTAGVDLDNASEGDTMKAYVIAYGMGLYGRDAVPVFAGPPGRMVWDNSLSGQHSSTKEFKILPESWNHYGKDFVAYATDTMRVHFNDMLSDTYDEIVALNLSNYIKVG